MSAAGVAVTVAALVAATTPRPQPSPALLPQYATPDAQRLASPFMVDANGCTVQRSPMPSPRRRTVDDPNLTTLYASMPYMLHIERGDIYVEAGRYDQAVDEFNEALPLVPQYVTANREDLLARLPLSIALFLSGRVKEAKEQWQAMLSREPDQFISYPSEEGVLLLRHGKYKEGFGALYAHPPPYNQVTFGDLGASAHLGKGLKSASAGYFAQAIDEWRLAETCAAEGFQVPYLLMGFVYEMRGQRSDAIDAWIKTLATGGAMLPDTASVSLAQYDAMRQLAAITT